MTTSYLIFITFCSLLFFSSCSRDYKTTHTTFHNTPLKKQKIEITSSQLSTMTDDDINQLIKSLKEKAFIHVYISQKNTQDMPQTSSLLKAFNKQLKNVKVMNKDGAASALIIEIFEPILSCTKNSPYIFGAAQECNLRAMSSKNTPIHLSGKRLLKLTEEYYNGKKTQLTLEKINEK